MNNLQVCYELLNDSYRNFFLGFGGNPTIIFHYSFIKENSQGNFREVQNVGVQVFFENSLYAIIALSYFITYWRWLTVSIVILSVFLNIGNLLIFIIFIHKENICKDSKLICKIKWDLINQNR
ncbi:unnamed protein product [Paramecium primaurelia]|uniref:Uncharacterized protein n=1 Tax=Paramecium primaurelia TaxID=5886 RepID=A0A8S1QRG9_PARPR|nr:unnamed protein product [Paramecium primaurelia]